MAISEKLFLKNLGQNIVRFRKEKGLSQLDVCALIDMEAPNLSSIENGRQNATSLTLLKIANALDVEVKDFFHFNY